MGAYQGVIGIDGIFLDCYDYTGTHIRDVTEYRSIYLMRASNPKLGSVSGFLPTCYGTRAEYRAACRRIDGNNDDSTWRQKDWQLTSAIQLLFLIEYATPNSQYCLTKTLTGGLTNISSEIWIASVVNTPSGYTYNPIVPTGGTNTGFTDYHYRSSSGWRVAAVGGRAFIRGLAGLFCLCSRASPTTRLSNYGGRLSL